jgi:hypothetical protein
MFDHDHSIGAIGHHGAGGDLCGLLMANLNSGQTSHRNAARQGKAHRPVLPGPYDIISFYRITVHRSAIETRNLDLRYNLLSEDEALGTIQGYSLLLDRRQMAKHNRSGFFQVDQPAKLFSHAHFGILEKI